MKKHSLASLLKQKKQKKTLQPLPEKALLTATSTSQAYEKCGVIFLAGGQGTRLGSEGPKGCFKLPLTPKKSLFQIHFENIRKKAKEPAVAIMTSPLNDQTTRTFLNEHEYFGLDSDHIDFFKQEMMPLCDEAGNALEEVPDGNGKALFLFYASPIWKKWKAKNVHYVQIIPIDNPLANPFDEEFLGTHEKEHVDLVIKCIKPLSADEKLGSIGLYHNKLMISEYTERASNEPFHLAYTGLFSCTLEWIETLSKLHVTLPWHLVLKENFWRFETFIFDLFPFARTFCVILAERKKCFAPLKKREDIEDIVHTLER